MQVLITHWPNHWDKVKTTSFPLTMIKPTGRRTGVIDVCEVVFAKIKKDAIDLSRGNIEKVWKGRIRTKKKANKMLINIEEIKECELDRCILDIMKKCEAMAIQHAALVKPKSDVFSGWYVLAEEDRPDPGLMDILQDTFKYNKEWKSFEISVHRTLILLGAHRLYSISQKEQHGKPDGLFTFEDKRFAVIYDATVNPGFEEIKKQQIANYVQMFKSPFSIENSIFNLPEYAKKQVWIITNKIDDVKTEKWDLVDVKYIGFGKLKSVLHKKLSFSHHEKFRLELQEWVDELSCI